MREHARLVDGARTRTPHVPIRLNLEIGSVHRPNTGTGTPGALPGTGTGRTYSINFGCFTLPRFGRFVRDDTVGKGRRSAARFVGAPERGARLGLQSVANVKPPGIEVVSAK
jgi:hypothetical protein